MNNLTHDERIAIIRLVQIIQSGSDDGKSIADMLDNKMCLDDLMIAAKKIEEFNFG